MMICKDGAVLVKAYAMSLYPSIPHETGLKTLTKRLNEPAASKIPTEDIYQDKSGTAIGTKFKPRFACIFMDEVETEFLKSEPFLWLRYINGIFFYMDSWKTET